MLSYHQLKILSVYLSIFVCGSATLTDAQVNERVAKIRVEETAGLARELQYIQVDIQVNPGVKYDLYAEDISTGSMIPCQTYIKMNHGDKHVDILTVIFPVLIRAFEKKIIILRKADRMDSIMTDLRVSGEGTELIIENDYYTADLRRSEDSPAKSHYSGQLRELNLKMGFDLLLFRTENRMHWAPNFKKRDMEDYYTISDWDQPRINQIYSGPYCTITERQDFAPVISEIFLSAGYKYYAHLPYFLFTSMMEVVNDVWLDLLRNDEMTMDSLFTHIAYQKHDNKIIDLPFSTREQVLKDEPIPADAPWLCFYHDKKGYAFGSIRMIYVNRNEFGHRSPTYNAHTKISDGAGGGKYWNRRLIDDQPVFVPAGYRYYEQNAYLVFKIDSDDKFNEIRFWAERLRNPPVVSVIKTYN